MTTQAALMKEIESLPQDRLAEILDFVGYLKQQETRRTEPATEPCPLCARYTEPNEETIAAFEEGDAMERGEIPAQRFHSLEELLADLRS